MIWVVVLFLLYIKSDKIIYNSDINLIEEKTYKCEYINRFKFYKFKFWNFIGWHNILYYLYLY